LITAGIADRQMTFEEIENGNHVISEVGASGTRTSRVWLHDREARRRA